MTEDREFAMARRGRQTGQDSLAQRRESRRRRNAEDAGSDEIQNDRLADKLNSRRTKEADAGSAADTESRKPASGPADEVRNDSADLSDGAHDTSDSGSSKADSTVLNLTAGAGAALRRRIDQVSRLSGQVSANLKRPRLRLLPSVIFVAVIMLGFRLGDVWTGIEQGAFTGPGVSSRAEDTSSVSDEETGDQENAQETSSGASADRDRDERPGLLESLRDGNRSATERELLDELAERRDDLEAREQELAEREALQEIAERRIEEKMAELEDLRGQIRNLLGEVDGERERQLAGLVSIYENMRPGDAARIFDGLDMDVLIDVLDGMAQRRSAPIIASMQPERAREVTSELADRGQLPDLEPLQD